MFIGFNGWHPKPNAITVQSLTEFRNTKSIRGKFVSSSAVENSYR